MISSKQLSILYTVLFICAALLSTVYTAQAAEYVVTPLVINLDLKKRDIVSEQVTIVNNEDRVIRLYATVNNVATNGDGVVESFKQAVESDRTNTATTWVEISRKRIELKPGETREIPFTIRMNPLTEPGDYNVFIGFAEGSNRPQAETKVAQGKAPGTIVHIAVDQEQNQFLRLKKFVVDKFLTGKEPGSLTYILSNPGEVDVVPMGEVIIYDSSGNEVRSIDLNTEKKEVPAEKSTEFTLELPSDFSMGKYKAFLSVEYGDFLTASVQDTTFFYVMPLKAIIISFLSVLFVAVLLTIFIHTRGKKDEELDGTQYVSLYVRDGVTDTQEHEHDIDLSKK